MLLRPNHKVLAIVRVVRPHVRDLVCNIVMVHVRGVVIMVVVLAAIQLARVHVQVAMEGVMDLAMVCHTKIHISLYEYV